MTILTARNLAIGYRHSRRSETVVARDLALDLQPNELVCLLGPNGAGKSTLMRTLAGMQDPLAGNVLLNGNRVDELSRNVLARLMSIVSTERVDAGNLSAYELVSLGRHPYTDWYGRLRAEDHAVITQSIHAVGAEALSHRPVNELSDGERQKIMIARALSQEPSVILLDEPTAFLDLPRRVEIVMMLRKLASQRECAVLLSTHDLDLALRNADRIWLLQADGTMHVGMPEELVLNGAFTTAFQSEGIEFDRQQGIFRLYRHPRPTAILSGRGEWAFWTSRALERIGFEVDSGRGVSVKRLAALEVQVSEQAGAVQWTVLNSSRKQAKYDSLQSLIQDLRTRQITNFSTNFETVSSLEIDQ